MPLRSSDPDSDSDSDTTGSGDGLGVSARSSRDGEESEEGSGREGAIVRWRMGVCVGVGRMDGVI